MPEAEKTIGAKELRRLVSLRAATGKRASEERGAWGNAFKSAQEKFNVNPIAFQWAARLDGMQDAGRASRIIRDFIRYTQLLEVGGQTDLEDLLEPAEPEAAPEPEEKPATRNGARGYANRASALRAAKRDTGLDKPEVFRSEDGLWFYAPPDPGDGAAMH